MNNAKELADDRLQQVRKKLLENNYTETFGIESFDLVSHLLSDLISTTQSYKQVQERENRLASDLFLVQTQLFPLRKENARLARENHDLHLDNIKLNEDMRSEMETFSKRIRLLNDEITELKMLNKACEDQLRSKDFLIDQLRDAYESVVDPALKSRNTTHSTIKISSKLAPPPNNNMNRKESWDTIRKATSSAENMEAHSTDQVIQNHLFQANQRVRALEEENNKLKSSLASRELELSRAGKLIGDAAISNNSLSPNYYDSIANSTQVTEAANKRIIDQLNGQVDFLNDQLAQREAQLATVTKKWSTVESLESELDLKTSMVDNLKEENTHLVTRVRALEKKLLNYAASHNHRAENPNSASLELKALDEQRSADQEKYHELEIMYQKLKQEKDLIQHDLIKVQKQLDSAKRAASPPKSTSTTSGNSKSSASKSPLYMRDDKNKDKALIHELNEEVETLRKRNKALLKQVSDLENKVSYLSSKSPSVDSPMSNSSSMVAVLTAERNQLQQILNEKELTIVTIARDYEHRKSLHSQVVEELQTSQSELVRVKGELRAVEEQHKALEEDYNQYREKFAQALNRFYAVEEQKTQSGHDYHALSIVLSDKEQEIVVLNRNIETLQEKISRQNQLLNRQDQNSAAFLESSSNQSEEYRRYLEEFRADSALYKEKYEHVQNSYSELTSEFETLQHEYHVSRQEYQALYDDYAQLKTSYQGQNKKYLELDLQYQDLLHQYQVETKKKTFGDEELKKAQSDYHNLHSSFLQLKETVHNLEHDQVLATNKVNYYEKMVENMKAKSLQSEEDMRMTKQQIYALDDELNRYKELTLSLRQENSSCEAKISGYEEEVYSLKKQLELSLTYRKDLEDELRKCMDREERYKKDINAKNEVIIILEQKNSQYEASMQNMKHNLQQKNVSITHNNEDLMLMTKENQILNSQLLSLNKDIQGLSSANKEQSEKIKYLEHEKRVLEIEKNDLLAHVNGLLKDRSRFEEEVQSLTSQQHDSIHKVHALTQHVSDLEQELRVMTSSTELKTHERASAQTQLQQFNEHIVTLQKKIESIEADNRRLMQDTHGLKQTNAMLNERLTIVMKRASAAQENTKLLTSRLSAVERERDTLRAVVEVERQRSADMSKLAETARIENATKDIHLQRLQSELSSLTVASASSTPSPPAHHTMFNDSR